jgi:hypothetical protein
VDFTPLDNTLSELISIGLKITETELGNIDVKYPGPSDKIYKKKPWWRNCEWWKRFRIKWGTPKHPNGGRKIWRITRSVFKKVFIGISVIETSNCVYKCMKNYGSDNPRRFRPF